MSNSRASFWKANGLSLVLGAIFLACLLGQAWSGHVAFNEELVREGELPVAFVTYLGTAHFLSATFENWESEFLQMGMYVLLTVKLRQRGSAESRPLSPAKEEERIDEGPKPWPVRAGGLYKRIYANSLSIALMLLFAVSFAGHVRESWRLEAAERLAAEEVAPSLAEHLASAQFWFESMQNWQSEFLAVLALVLLSIMLRQKDSPESKAVEAPHGQTGT